MNEQDINEFRRMERKFYRKMKNTDVFKTRLFVTYFTMSKEERCITIKNVQSISDVPFVDYQIRVRINIVVNPKRSKRYKCFNKILQRYLYKKCLETGYEYRHNHDGICFIPNPYFIFTKVNTSEGILNQLE